MRITKEMAENIASKLTAEKYKALEKLKKELSQVVTECVEDQIPEPIMKCFNKYKNYFETRGSVQFIGNGFNHEHFNLSKAVPYPKYNIVPGDQYAKEIRIMNDNLEKMDGEYRKLKKEISTALFSLRTRKQVEEKFPEAIPFLPAATQALTININKIREKL